MRTEIAAASAAAAGAVAAVILWRRRRRGSECDFVFMGSTGFIGSKMLDAIVAQGYAVDVPGGIRLHQRTELRSHLERRRPRLGVICCAGTRGNPNIDWCDAHPIETIDANVTGQLNVATVCAELGLHCALVGTGFVFAGVDGKRYTEADVPDSSLPKAYVRFRIILEELLTHYPNVLNLRVIYPITRDLDDKRGLIGKLAGFEKVDDAKSCCTFLEDLCPLVPHLMKKRVAGNLNFTNPGVVSYRSIVERLKARIPGYNPDIRPPGGRPAIDLDSRRLVDLCAPEFTVPTAQESLERIFA